MFAVTADETGRESESALADMVDTQIELFSAIGIPFRWADKLLEYKNNMCVGYESGYVDMLQWLGDGTLVEIGGYVAMCERW